ncbi:PLAC8 motif-containing protein [Dioscorea alata]|uniref:PLAC8 motif-containing protein n=1 Tax=Dioscorea alata TaxID=55571 RepID=A0ACB7VTV5_DIOAL|nr:PLAC8 motif-containing protein [Dioscorea alata]
MVSNEVDDCIEEANGEDQQILDASTPKLTEYVLIRVPSIKTKDSDHRSKRRRLLDILKARPSRAWLKKFKFSSPFAACREAVKEHEEVSLSVPTPAGARRFHVQFIRKINWSKTLNVLKEWIKNPMNIALFIWLICVAVALAMLALLLLGLLDQAFPSQALQNYWIEINNQVLNALFTLMSLYQHPNLFHHMVLLCRWRSEDITELRKIYCKNGAYRPHEWAHMTVVVVLLNVACFSQYFLCALYWAYRSSDRPEIAETLLVILGTATPVVAGVYTVYSPLGKEYESDSNEEESSTKQLNKTGLKLYDRKAEASRPEWAGGLFDCGDDVTACSLSFFCTCCVLGWNMERLGFGNMYVHMVLFLLLCIAPFFIFNVSALNIHNDVIADVVGITGRVISVFGLLYGGYWRIEMRKRFKLPGNTHCCGSETLTDYLQWMFCWSCSLAQEVRTANLYDIEDGNLYRKEFIDIIDDNIGNTDSDDDEEFDSILQPLNPSSSSESEESCELPLSDPMAPPTQPSMQLQETNEIVHDSQLIQKEATDKTDTL